MNAEAEHPSREKLVAFGQGRLATEAAEVVAEHVAECESCCEVLGEVANDTLADQIRATGADTTVDLRDGVSSRPSGIDRQTIPPDLVDHPRYRMVRLLGAGGMGTVFQAEHRVMNRVVAIKVINRELTNQPEVVERFRQEVRAAATLSHPNIVTAHDAEQTGELHFLVMEYVEGTDLARYVHKKGPLEPGLVAHVGRQVALGLNHAAQHGMVHRDIKPQNLIITKSGRVRILDFGLARLGRRNLQPDPVDSDADILRRSATTLTLRGSILGTPDYIAPEQALDSRNADIRADIYSLGCTLYFLLTGQPPFPGGSVMSKLLAHQKKTPQPISELRPEVPAALVDIVCKMMSRNLADRHESANDVAKQLLPLAKSWLKTASLSDEPMHDIGGSSLLKTDAETTRQVDSPTDQDNDHEPPIQSKSKSKSKTKSKANARPLPTKVNWKSNAERNRASTSTKNDFLEFVDRARRTIARTWRSRARTPIVVAVAGVALLMLAAAFDFGRGTLFGISSDPVQVSGNDALNQSPDRVDQSRDIPGVRQSSPQATGDLQTRQQQAATQLRLADVVIEIRLSPTTTMKLVVIPPGETVIGTTPEQLSELAVTGSTSAGPGSRTNVLTRIRDFEMPAIDISIPKPFLIARTEVTVAQFRAFAADTGYVTDAEKSAGWGSKSGSYSLTSGFSWKNLGDVPVHDQSPATNVSWNDARAFCVWLSEKKQTGETHQWQFRLPVEAEWEYACRAGSDTPWYFGPTASRLSEFAVCSSNSNNRPQLVATRQPNGFGLFDMLGNESEWCLDVFRPYPPLSQPVVIDARFVSQAAAGNAKTPRVQRGGGFFYGAMQLRSAWREAGNPSSPTHGAFRIVAEPVD